VNKQSRRCPFLEGQCDGVKRFEGVDTSHRVDGTFQKTKFDNECSISGVLFNSWSSYQAEHGCLIGDFPSCQYYATRVLELSLNIPTVCPVAERDCEKDYESYNCKQTKEFCDCYWIDINSDDYRKCETFSLRLRIMKPKSDNYCGTCSHREIKYCKECADHNNWRIIPPIQVYAYHGERIR
jgi:hypothetical protein